MRQELDVEVVVFDVLGTMVDEPSGLRTAIREATAPTEEAALDEWVSEWGAHVEQAQRRIGAGLREYVNTDVIDHEAAQLIADRAGSLDAVAVDRLATAGHRLDPWHDSVSALERLGDHLPVLGLSNASRAALTRLNAHSGLRWHLALSAEAARAYKPSPAVYQLALDAAGCPPERVLMAAAHAWDLRGAQAVGMRTAYIRRPVGDPPRGGDRFDWSFDGLDGLLDLLEAPVRRSSV